MPSPNTAWPRRGLYLLTPEDPDTERLCARVDTALAAGACLLQYRSKLADPALREAQARALLGVCLRHAVPLLINDDVRLARIPRERLEFERKRFAHLHDTAQREHRLFDSVLM